MRNKYQRSLDIEKGEVIRVVLMQTPGTESHNRLLMVIHHLAVDGVSWRILLEDLEGLLTALMQGEQPLLGQQEQFLPPVVRGLAAVWAERRPVISKTILAAGSRKL